MAIGQSQGVLLGLGGSVLTGLDGAGQQQQQQQTARERLPHNQSVGAAAAGSSRPDKRVAAEAKVCRSGLDDVREPLQTPPTTPYKHSRGHSERGTVSLVGAATHTQYSTHTALQALHGTKTQHCC